MSNTYDLSDNVKDDFPFVIRGKKYVMRYPLTSEVERVQVLSTQIETAQEEKRADDVEKLSAQLEDYLYDFVSPVEHDEPIKDALNKENIKVMRNFNHMIKAELSIS